MESSLHSLILPLRVLIQDVREILDLLLDGPSLHSSCNLVVHVSLILAADQKSVVALC